MKVCCRAPHVLGKSSGSFIEWAVGKTTFFRGLAQLRGNVPLLRRFSLGKQQFGAEFFAISMYVLWLCNVHEKALHLNVVS